MTTMKESRAGRAMLCAVSLAALTAVLLGSTASSGAWFTATAAEESQSVRTATLAPILPGAKVLPDQSIELTWPAGPSGGVTPHYVLSREIENDPSSRQVVYTGTGTTAIDRAEIPAELGERRVDRFTKVAAGNNHSCAIAEGRAYCWGRNSEGQLGDGTTTASTRPVPVVRTAMSGTVTDIAVGFSHTCAIADGRAYCWGSDGDGRLGVGGGSSRSEPAAVSGDLPGTVTAIATGYRHTCAIADGAAYCWGWTRYGQVGNGEPGRDSWGNDRYRVTPQRVLWGMMPSGTTFTSISTGTTHSCGIAGGRAYCWGAGTDGQLGLSGVTASASPIAVSTAAMSGRVTAIATARQSSCAISGVQVRIFCWGQGGAAPPASDASAPREVSPGARWISITSLEMGRDDLSSTGGDYGCLTEVGIMHCWGDGAHGVLGNGSPVENRAEPRSVTQIPGMAGDIATGGKHTCVAVLDGARCWGSGDGGGLGNGTSGTSYVAVEVAPIRDWVCPAGALVQPSTPPGGRPTCSFAAGTRLIYRLDQLVGGWTSPTGVTGVTVVAAP